MPTYAYIDVSGSSYLGDPNVQNKVVSQTGYSGLWFKKVSGAWFGFSTQPQGTTATKNFAALVPNPLTGTTYVACFGEDAILYNGTNNPIELYYETTESKWKCGRPGDR